MLAIFYVYNNNDNSNEYFLREFRIEPNRIESKNIIL